jgi:hypothetical protein
VGAGTGAGCGGGDDDREQGYDLNSRFAREDRAPHDVVSPRQAEETKNHQEDEASEGQRDLRLELVALGLGLEEVVEMSGRIPGDQQHGEKKHSRDDRSKDLRHRSPETKAPPLM